MNLENIITTLNNELSAGFTPSQLGELYYQIEMTFLAHKLKVELTEHDDLNIYMTPEEETTHEEE